MSTDEQVKLAEAILKVEPVFWRKELVVRSIAELLASHDAELTERVREEDARIADEYLIRNPHWNSYHQDAQIEIARAIRAKRKEVEL